MRLELTSSSFQSLRASIALLPGSDSRARTCDIFFNREALCQLSYVGVKSAGIEPASTFDFAVLAAAATLTVRSFSMTVGAHEIALPRFGKLPLVRNAVSSADAKRLCGRISVIEIHYVGRIGLSAVDADSTVRFDQLLLGSLSPGDHLVHEVILPGGSKGTRTPDPHRATVVLSQLSYGPMVHHRCLTQRGAPPRCSETGIRTQVERL